MKTKVLILTIFAVSMVFQLSAKVWYVNNRTILTKAVDADFTTLQDAIDDVNVLANDTIYIEGSATAYGNGVFDKPLVVIGTGYFLTENDTTQAYENQSQVGQLIFNAGSEGSVVMGLYCYSSSISNIIGVSINTDSITIKKNHVGATNNASTWSHYSYAIKVAAAAQDVYIMQNFIQPRVTNQNNVSYGLVIGAGAKCVVSNNIFRSYSTTGTHFAIYTANDATNEIYINNNVFYGYDLVSYYSVYLNNIQIGGTYNNPASDYSAKNLCDGTQFPVDVLNQQGVVMSDVFVDYTSTVDSGFVLIDDPTNPAIGAGINSGDCGVFSNDTGFPYVLSGMPDIPANFSFSITADVGVNTLPVTIKAVSHNEGK